MKVTIVIPVYNEALSLAACLQAISIQSVAPYEVIVVDNNSSDNSAAIASSFEFVQLIHEPLQGVIHARTAGFNLAQGEIIARIDADSLIPNDWVEQIIDVFADSELDAVSGKANYYDLAYSGFFDSVDLFFRRRLSQQLGDRMYLWGANMAVRKSAWDLVRSDLCNCAGIHEDFDIAIHLQELGAKVGFDERLTVGVSSRRVDTDYLSFLRYAWTSPLTYAEHNIRGRYHMYPIVALSAIGYFPARFLHKAYDAQTASFSLSRAIASDQSIARVDPTTYVA